MCCFRLRLSFLVSREETLQVYRISKGRGVAFKLVKFAFLKLSLEGVDSWRIVLGGNIWVTFIIMKYRCVIGGGLRDDGEFFVNV